MTRSRNGVPVEGIARRGGVAGRRPDKSREGTPDEKELARLRQSLAEKEEALQRATQTAFQLQKQLDVAEQQNETLRKKTDSSAVKSWGGIAGAARIADRRPDRPRRVLGKTASAVKATSKLPQSALAELARDRAREIRTRLVAATVSVAVVATVWALWAQIPQREFWRNTQPLPAAIGVARTVPIRPGEGNGESHRNSQFNQALSRLNSVLMYSPGSAEQLLNAARQSGLSRHRNVCDFSWNGGQPALLYHEGRLIYSQLDDCASAVETYIDGQENAPAGNGRGG